MILDADLRVRRGSLGVECVIAASNDHTLALLGPNGAGKTTILRVIAGLLRMDAGRVTMDGTVFEDTSTAAWLPPEVRGVGLMQQEHRLFPHLSVVDNIAFGLRSRGVGRTAAHRRAEDWLERLGLRSYAASHPGALSGGQAQQVALARALITEPRVLLLDEPLASVDAAARLELRRTLREHLAGFAGVRVLVTHDPVEAAGLADRVLIVEAGRVVQEGTFSDVTARPRSTWVARMAGLNLLRGDVTGSALRLANGEMLTVATALCGSVLAAIHPRAVALHRQPPAGSPRNVLRGTVASIDPDGDRWRIGLDGAVPLVAEVTPRAAAELRLSAGGDVFAAVKATAIDVYSV